MNAAHVELFSSGTPDTLARIPRVDFFCKVQTSLRPSPINNIQRCISWSRNNTALVSRLECEQKFKEITCDVFKKHSLRI